MAILNPLFILGLVVIFYLLSFVLFAVVRIATGISIQRVGYFSLRRISYTLRDGVRLDIRGLGLHFHRPNFARPTWVSLRLSEIKVTIDIKAIAGKDAKAREGEEEEDEEEEDDALGPAHGSPPQSSKPGLLRRSSSSLPRSQTWKKLTQLKEKIKTLHGKIGWLRMVDVEVLNSSCDVLEVGSIQVGSLTMAVDTRRRTVDRGRLFRHKKTTEGEQQPAEWMFVVKGVLFTPDGKESQEIVDICSLNVHGLLFKDLAGLRDASVSLKLGRIHIPYDDILDCQARVHGIQRMYGRSPAGEHKRQISFTDIMEEFDAPGSREEKIVQTVSDSKEFIASLLRGIQEIQLAVSFIGLSKEIRTIKPSGRPLYLNFAMNEFGIDLFRLDPKSPAHRMYFSHKDIAHQALLAAISIGVSIDDGGGKPERLLYVPMATTTVKSTLPSKTIANSSDTNAAERNANILFANLVVTSPSIDLDLKHMPVVLALLQRRQSHAETTVHASPGHHRQHLISRLLPKASIRISIQEPVLRVVLPPLDNKSNGSEDYDLLISSVSSISLDLESSHASAGELHYALTANLRMSSQHLYYQTSSADRHNLLISDALELRIQVTATPEVSVVASGSLETFSVHMTRPEISKGVRQIVKQLKSHQSRASTAAPVAKLSFLRTLPPWLTHFQFKGSNFGVEVAGVDSGVSPDLRGIALKLESWSADYKIQKNAGLGSHKDIHRALSNSLSSEDGPPKLSRTPRLKKTDSTDGRKLATHVQGFQGFVVEGANQWESEPFISMPKFEIVTSTSSDEHGLVFHLHCHMKALYLQYSLFRYYSASVAQTVIQKAFAARPQYQNNTINSTLDVSGLETSQQPARLETLTMDVKTTLVQIKANMPADPPMMLRLYGAEFSHLRWGAPYLKARLVRMYAEAPSVKFAWAGIVSVKNVRVDLRESRRKIASRYVDEKSIDISTEVVRLCVPHQLVLHKIFDNFANTIKATEQLHHRFKTGTDEYVLKKQPEQPKRVPRISLRSRNLIFVMEDGSFEWKLGTIYRVGLREQKQRLAREEAFNLKVKKLEESSQRRHSQQRREPSRSRTQAGVPKSRSRSKLTKSERQSGSAGHRRDEESTKEHRGRHMRYDTEAVGGLTGDARISAQEAWKRLQEHNAASWKKRVTFAMKYQTNSVKDIRAMFSADDEILDTIDDHETIMAVSSRPGLMCGNISDLHVIIDKPSFPIHEYPKFLHRVGKGLPYDTEYALLIPMSLQINMGEARVTLRNYPLPLLHVPAIKAGQSSRLPSWSLKTDFAIAEEYRNEESIKHVRVAVVPASKFIQPQPKKTGFFVDVRRTVSPVKTYSDVDISINTSNPTSITWGTSYQPAIQDMMQIIENFTKPQIDPSERVGFWDKIRLVFHSRVRIAWRGDGDVHLKLKGSRDPYVVTGHGAGFTMCFRNDVRWDIHQDDDPKKFMTVSCGEYVLAIPDYSHQARDLVRDGSGEETESLSSSRSQQNSAMFQKVIMKLSGNVRWMAGLVFERDLQNSGRSFKSSPHYDVTFKTPDHAKSTSGQIYDAFRGFRSHHIHLSIAVLAPVDRDWSVTNVKPSTSYNSMHLSPRFFTHFFDWWSLFSGVMSLPIRQGRLFPGVEKSTKKFGRHLATIKYNLLLSPFYMAHIYKHKDVEDYAEDTVGATGLKLRIDSFMLDLHQRREEFMSQENGSNKMTRTTGMRINKAQLDFIAADMRAVSASIAGTSPEDLKRASNSQLASFHVQSPPTPDYSKFTIPDNDFMWIDMDDFVELDWILPAETHPETKIMPLAFAPRFTYFRQTDHHGVISGDPGRNSNFGDEPTHFCIMSQDNDPQRVQCDLIKNRIATLNDQLNSHRQKLGDHELRVIRDSHKGPSAKEDFESLSQQVKIMEDKLAFLQSMLDTIMSRLEKHGAAPDSDQSSEHRPESYRAPPDNSAQILDLTSDFNNRFIIHNIQLKWNNSLRNIILRYVHQVSQRRGFVYYMSRRAIKFILDIVDEQNRSKESRRDSSSHAPTPTGQSSPSMSFKDNESNVDLNLRIEELLQDGKNFVNADDPSPQATSPTNATGDIGKDISDKFAAQNSYHVRLIAPQIQLQSEKNPKSVLLVTAKGMELKVIQIMDRSRIADEISGLVQRRFSVDMEGVQFFVTNQKTLNTVLHLYTASYGAPKGSAWPPWAPLEVNFDFHENPFGWARVVQETSASLRYDKYNTLRLKYNDEVSKGDAEGTSAIDDLENRIDHIWVDFPQIKAICDSVQYYGMYLIVLDLLLYTEPLEKSRSERLEKIMLAADFSDLTGAPEMVVNLQERIRQLEEIKGQFQLNAKYLDRQGWSDRLSIERDLASCEDELFFMMKAITTSQRKNDDRNQAQSNGLLRWYLSASEIVWHLMREKNEPLMEFQLKNAAYDRTDNSDGSNYNIMEIERIHGLNLLPDALYPEMIAPYFEGSMPDQDDIKMFKVQWYMLEAIAGIPVLDQFEVNLFPLKIQLEREVGKKLFEYVFPDNSESSGASPFMVKHMAPVHDEDEESEQEDSSQARSTLSPPSFADFQNSTRAGSIELRLRPTLNLLSSQSRPGSSRSNHSSRVQASSAADGQPQHFKFFHSNKSASRSSIDIPESQRRSRDSLQSLARSTQGSLASRASSDQRLEGKAASIISSTARDTTKISSAAEISDRPRRFGLVRTVSKDNGVDKEKASDDLTEMMSRASNYMTLAYVKIPSVVLCLSYKGRGERNIEDVHDFVFRMPALEYRNKTWSNLDLALRLKKDVIKALISHTGAIIGNKLSHHRPNKTQQSRLREIAHSSSLLPNTNSLSNTLSRRSTVLGHHRSPNQAGNGNDGTQSDTSSLDDRHRTMHGSTISGTPSTTSLDQDDGLEMKQSGFSSTSRRLRDRSSTITANGTLNRDGDLEEKSSHRKSTVLNLGKKFFHNLN